MHPPLPAWLSTALARLDLLLHREILRLRARYKLSLDEFRGLYVSDEAVDAMIDDHRSPAQEAADASFVATLTSQAAIMRDAALRLLPEGSRFGELVHRFILGGAEQDLLLLALAPEFDAKYETLYAYLQNDVSRKAPSLDLALRVFREIGETEIRAALLPQGKLLSSGLLYSSPGLDGRSCRTESFHLTSGIPGYLAGLPFQHPELRDVTRLESDPPLGSEASDGWPDWDRIGVESRVAVVISGRHGSGRLKLARRLASRKGRPLLRVDLEQARSRETRLLRWVRLQQRLENAILCLEGLDCLFEADGRPAPDARAWLGQLLVSGAPTFIIASPNGRSQEVLAGTDMVEIEVPAPSGAERAKLWSEALVRERADVDRAAIDDVADRFVLTPRDIELAARSASRSRNGKIDLHAAARRHSTRDIGKFAQRVTLNLSWSDLILPDVSLARLRDIAQAIRDRAKVYSRWGFSSRLGEASGVRALLAGPSGTGKSMSAAVLARDLETDLYRIDLSSVVSKYIGETEKNLDRVFQAAIGSNAILFFDEADALFGKRTEVKDAHDRYANIEIAYLLQKIEDFEGTVLLATNLSKNIDEAFARRMQYVVEFPLPDEARRERLWRGMFPDIAPVAKDVDIPFLAMQFKLSGGDIRNIALDSAFLAAAEGEEITMRHVVAALCHQITKEGRVPSYSDFKQYRTLCPGGV